MCEQIGTPIRSKIFVNANPEKFQFNNETEIVIKYLPRACQNVIVFFGAGYELDNQ